MPRMSGFGEHRDVIGILCAQNTLNSDGFSMVFSLHAFIKLQANSQRNP